MIKIETVQQIHVLDWDDLVAKTYGRPYNFQQQDGCKDREVETIEVPYEDAYDFEDQDLQEVLDGHSMGVPFAEWLDRRPELSHPCKTDFSLGLWWARNFYPSVEMVANDLHAKGLLPAGEYQIKIDW